ITRPRGKPPTPRAASIEMEPVGITFTGTSTSRFPRRMIEPLPYCFSICAIARSRFFVFSSDTLAPRGFSPAFPGDAGGTVYQNACPALNPHLYGHITTRRTKSKDYFGPGRSQYPPLDNALLYVNGFRNRVAN